MGISSSASPSSKGIEEQALKPTESSRKFIAIVAVVMLISATMVTAFYWYSTTFEVEEALSSTDVKRITEDVVWKGKDRVLERPIIVTNGASLRIQDCYLKVLLEDLFLWNLTWFTVEDGGTLVLKDSTLEVIIDERLDDAVYIGHLSTTVWDPDGRIPYISRIVNLVGTDDPILGFDVAWRGDVPRLMVVGQKGIGTDLGLLATFEYEDLSYGEWTHHEVGLKDLRDHIARIAIAPMKPKMDALMISNVTITDGGKRLPWDLLRTGDPIDDGWDTGGPGEVLSFEDEMKSWSLWPALIESYSVVRIDGSNILAPAGMPRWIKALVDWEQVIMPDNGILKNIDVVSRGCQIEINSGKLTVERSEIVHVPVIAWSSEVDILSTTVIGDANDVTLDECEGNIVDSDFIAVAPRGWRPFSYGHKFEGQYLWSLSLEGNLNGGIITVDHCTFEGAEIAIVAKDVNIGLFESGFSKVQQVGIWDNRADWKGGWSGTYDGLTFNDVEGFRYLRTSDKLLEFFGPSKPSDNDWGNYDGEGELLNDIDHQWPDIGLVLAEWDHAVLYMPVMLVMDDGTLENVDSVDVLISVDWAWYKVITIHSSDTTVDVWLTRDDEPSGPDPNYGPGLFHAFGSSFIQSNITGNVVLTVSLYNWTLSNRGFYKDLLVNVTMDGVLLGTYDAMEDIAREEYDLTREFDIPLSPGRNSINITLHGSNNTTVEPVLIDFENKTILRHTTTSDDGPLVESISHRIQPILIDPDVSVVLTDVRPYEYVSGDYVISRLWFILSNGCSVVLRSADYDQPDFIDLFAYGNGSIQLEDFSTRLLTLNSEDTHITLKDLTVNHSITSYTLTDVDLLIDNCTITLPGWEIYISTLDSRTVICNTTFRSPKPTDYIWELQGNSSIEVRDSTFVDVTFRPSPRLVWRYNVTVDVHGCTFQGRCSFLALTNPHYKDYGTFPRTFVEGTFVVNVGTNDFIGKNTGIVGFPEQIRALDGDNRMLEGSVVLAQFKACVTVEMPGSWREYIPIFMDAARGMDKTFMGRSYEEGEDPWVLIDVTDDPSIRVEPTHAWVMIRKGDDREEVVVGFFEVPISNVTTVLTPPQWNYLDNIFPSFLQSLGEFSNDNGSRW
jgi:hypothetical protein